MTMLWIVLGLLLAVAVYDLTQKRHAILRSFPVIGHFRYLFEAIGPELRQYIVTDNDQERPFSRDQRRWVYTSAKEADRYFGFGTDNDLELSPNYLIWKHAAFARDEPRGAHQVDVERPAPVGAAGRDPAVDIVAGGVDDGIEPAEAPDRLGDQRCDLGVVGHVGGDEKGGRAEIGGERTPLGFGDVGDGDLPAGRHEGAGNGGADAGRATRDDHGARGSVHRCRAAAALRTPPGGRARVAAHA